jgi:hypothetical protein
MHVPTLKEELERKTVDELERLVTARRLCRISNAQYQASVQTLWNAVSGLVSAEMMDYISQAARLTQRDHSFTPSLVFKDADRSVITIVTRDEGGTVYTIRTGTLKNESTIDFGAEYSEPLTEASQWVGKLRNVMKNKGFEEVTKCGG